MVKFENYTKRAKTDDIHELVVGFGIKQNRKDLFTFLIFRTVNYVNGEKLIRIAGLAAVVSRFATRKVFKKMYTIKPQGV